VSTTAYWQQVVPDEPLGSCHGLKQLLFEEGERLNGARTVIGAGSSQHIYLKGFRDALAEGERRSDLDEFLADLEKHKTLAVWIDE
jgi:hypothetical protein